MEDTVLIFLGPSGVGKDEVIAHMQRENNGLTLCKRHTTRPPRPNETSSYDFLDEETFRANLAAGFYLLPNQYAGYHYGVPRTEIERILSNGGIPVVKGTVDSWAFSKDQFEGRYPFFTVYLYPPTLAVLEERLSMRGTESYESFLRRFQEGIRELKQVHNGRRDLVDLHVVNQTNRPHEAALEILGRLPRLPH